MIPAVAFSPENRLAASLSYSGTVKIWNLEDGRSVSEFKADPFLHVDYEELKAGNFAGYGSGALAFFPDGRHLVLGSKKWDALTGRKVMDFQTPSGPGPFVAFSPDGAQLLSNHMIWETATGRRVKKMESIGGAVLSVYSADGKTIYSADSYGHFYVTDAGTGKLMRRFADHVYSASFDLSRDLKMMAAPDSTYPELTLWDSGAGKKISTITVDRPLSSVALTDDGRTFSVFPTASGLSSRRKAITTHPPEGSATSACASMIRFTASKTTARHFSVPTW
jgi:WD40 repeat protein